MWSEFNGIVFRIEKKHKQNSADVMKFISIHEIRGKIIKIFP